MANKSDEIRARSMQIECECGDGASMPTTESIRWGLSMVLDERDRASADRKTQITIDIYIYCVLIGCARISGRRRGLRANNNIRDNNMHINACRLCACVSECISEKDPTLCCYVYVLVIV